MSTVRLEAKKMDANSKSADATRMDADPAATPRDIPMQPASLDIWDKKYRLKTKAGTAVDADIDGTYQRVAKALAEA